MVILNEIIIRECRKEDLEKISEIVTRNLLEVNIKDYDEEIIKEYVKEFSKENIVNIFKNRARVFVATKNDEIIGTGGIEQDWNKEKGMYWILTVFVKPEEHNKGIGKKLIQKREEYAQSINVEKLIVPASITGNEFYHKLGYNYINGKKELNNDNNYMMEKILKE